MYKNSNYNQYFLIEKNLYNKNFNLILFLFKLRVFLNYKFFLDYIFNNYYGVYILKHSYETFYKIIDKGLLEMLYINYASYSLIAISRYFSMFHVSFIYSIISTLFLSLIIIINLFLFLF